jgi:hypothetical protein
MTMLPYQGDELRDFALGLVLLEGRKGPEKHAAAQAYLDAQLAIDHLEVLKNRFVQLAERRSSEGRTRRRVKSLYSSAQWCLDEWGRLLEEQRRLARVVFLRLDERAGIK